MSEKQEHTEDQLSMEQFEQKIAEAVTNGVQDDINKAVTEKVDEAIEKNGLDKTDRKHGVVPEELIGKSEEEQLEQGKKKTTAEFIKATVLKDYARMKDLSESTDSAGGFLVPEEFRSEVARIQEDFGLLRRFGRTVPMSTDTVNLPRVENTVSVSWPGEGNAGSKSQPDFENLRLHAKTAVGLTVQSNELLQDASVSVVDMLAELFAEALAGEEDDQAFNGIGSPFTGIINDSDVQSVTMASGDTSFSDINATKLSEMIAAVKTTQLQRREGSPVAFFMHRDIWHNVRTLQDTAGNFIYQPASFDSGLNEIGRIWGYPVYLSDKLPSSGDSAVSTKFVVFGNMRNVVLADRRQMTLTTSEHANVSGNSVYEQNQQAVRVTERIGIGVLLPKALATLQTAAS